MTDATCPICHAEQIDGALCHKCTGRLMGCLRLLIPETKPPLPAPKWGRLHGHRNMPVRELWPRGSVGRRQRLPWETGTEAWTGLSDQLVISYTRQGRRAATVGGKSTDRAQPYDQGAADATAVLRNTLTTWVRLLWYETEPLPRNTIPSMARWLMHRKDRMRYWEAAGELWRDMVDSIEGARRIIDARPTFTFVGPCEVCSKGDIYAPRGAATGVCRYCSEIVTGIPEMRERNDTKIKAMHLPRRQVLPALVDIYGLTIKDATLRKWIQRGKLQPVGIRIATITKDDTGEHYQRVEAEELYWVGEVLGLAAALRGTMATEGKPVAAQGESRHG